MGATKQKETPRPKRARLNAPFALVVALFSVCGIVVLMFIGLFVINASYKDKIFPGVKAGDVSLAGLTKERAQALLDERTSDIENKGITVRFQGAIQTIESTTASADNVDSALSLYAYDTHAIVEEAFSIGRQKTNGLINMLQQISALIFGKPVASGLAYDQEKVTDVLTEKMRQHETPAKNAHLKMTAEGAMRATAEESGKAFDYTQYAAQIGSQLAALQNPDVTFSLATDTPDITAKDVESFFASAQSVYGRAPFTVTWEDKPWKFQKGDVAAALDVAIVNNAKQLTFSQSGIEPFLAQIRKDVDVQAQDAKFSIASGKVVEFQSSRDGREVDVAAFLAGLQKLIGDASATSVALSVKDKPAEVTENNAASFGIKELVAEASTNFKGSPTNRRKNIANGAKLLYGLLIKPGEEFSLVTKLKPIDKSNGYLSELVIKGDRTIPEVGGGLCQIGTTMFRVVLNAGLPILERKNHSYRVSYYEPPVGMDATIYDAKPDFRFVNDYSSYLLLLTFVDGDVITFQLWGTKDNRKIEMTTPKIFNVTSPGPTKYIESDELKPGEEKCIEKAHKGGSAEFTYTVTSSSGEKKSQVFASKYKAWQAVCLVGKKSE